MRQIPKILLLLAVSLALFVPRVNATHQIGIDTYYECVGTNLFRFYNRGYYHCSSTGGMVLTNLWFNPANGQFCGQPSIATGGDWLTQNIITEATPICPTVISRCSDPNSPINGHWEALNFATFDFTNTSCDYYASWQFCCRNNSITSGAANNSYYHNQTYIDPRITPCNNSPVFSAKPIAFINLNDTSHFDQGANDPDGDSLVFSLGGCLRADTTLVTYSTGYGPQTPLGPNWDIQIDSSTGILTFTPTPGSYEIGPICIKVEEYRNGVKIGQIWRDVYAAVISMQNQNPTLLSPTNLINGTLTGDSIIHVAPGSQLCIDISANDPNSGQNLNLIWDHNIPGATWQDAITQQVTDTVSGTNPTARFCWLPTTPGIYQFKATVQDDHCPLYGWEDRRFIIEVGGPGLIAEATWLSCLTVQLTATPINGTGPFAYNWSGQGNIGSNPNSNTASFAHTYPGPGTYTYSVNVTDTSGFNETFSGSVTVTNLNAGNLLTAPPPLRCPPDSVIVWAPPAYAQYQWTNGDTTQFSWIHEPGIYGLTATDTLGCITTDSVEITRNVNLQLDGHLWYPGGPEMDNVVIEMLTLDLTDSTAFVEQTTVTDSLGNFTFDCPTPGTPYKFRAAVSRFSYPNLIPSYYGRWFVWQDANEYDWADPRPINMWTVGRQLQPGNGRISGTVLKNGQPVSGLTLFAVDSQKRPWERAVTDSTGYFEMTSLSARTYRIWVDKPFIENDLSPVIHMDNSALIWDSLDFTLRPTWLQLGNMAGLDEEAVKGGFEVKVVPNPVEDRAEVLLELGVGGEVVVRLMDMQGRKVQEVELGGLSGGEHRVEMGSWRGVPAGIYLLEVGVEGRRERIRVVVR